MKSKKKEDWAKYNQAVIMKQRTRKIFKTFETKLSVKNQGKADIDCYKKVMKMYSHLCGRDTNRDHEFFGTFYNYCTMGLGVVPAYQALMETCPPQI